MKTLLGFLIVVGLVIGAGAYYALHASADPPVNFRTVPVKQGDLVALVSATGTLEPEELVDVGSQVTGPIASLGKDPKDPSKLINYDSQVEVGTLLVKVDDSVYKAQYDQAKANLLHAQADLGELQAHLEQSEREWKRAESLYPVKAIADTDYDLAVANYKAAKANLEVGKATVKQNEAALAMAKRNLDYCTITSPVKGVIIDRRVNVGQTVVSNMAVSSVFLIAKDLRHMQVWASVNEADIGRIHEKMPVTFTVDAYPNEVFHGAVYQIRMNATMTQNVVTYTVVVETDNPDLRLLPYLTANVSFQVEQHANVLKVPNGALRWKPRLQMVAPEYRSSLIAAPKQKSEGKHDAAETKPPKDPKAAAVPKRADQPTAQGDPKAPPAAGDAKKHKSHAEHGQVWVKDGPLARPIKVRIGVSDGIDTEISGREVKEGMEVIIGELAPDEEADMSNPFAPKLFNRTGGAPKPGRKRGSCLMELIRLENITKTYHLGEVDVPVLKGVSLSIQRGEMVALMGASGSGKTTLMNILGCLDRPSSGQFWFDGEEMSQLTPNQRALVRTAKLGFVFQSFNLLARTSALLNVVMPLDYSPRRLPGAEARLRSQSLLERVGLGDRMDHEPSQMSGGQQQRVAIARSLVNKPSLLLADEPTGNLDSHTSVEILQMFQQLNTEGITVILVTHDPKVATFAHRTIRISDGLIEGDETKKPAGPEHGPTPTPARQPATEHLSGNGDGDAGVPRLVSPTVLSAALPDKLAVAPNPGAEPGSADPGRAADFSPPQASPAVAAATPEPAPVAAAGHASLYGDAVPKRTAHSLASLIPPTFRTALSALRRNKMRSALTALGVIIGVGAVIAMAEIGQGSKIAMQKTIASMGANNLLLQSGAASSGGVSFGSGSVLTLTPQDGDEIARQCPAVTDVAPIVRTGGQVIYGNRNWVPMNIYGTTPAYLAVRDWNDMIEGSMFTDRDVISGGKICVVGTTIKRELFQGESPVGKELRIQNVSLRVIGVLSAKGANMVGMDQDDIILAPWTTIKYRVTGSGSTNSVSAAAGSSSSSTSSNTLSNLYPSGTGIYPAASAIAALDTPQPVRFVNVSQILVKAASADQIPQAIDEITDLLRERHRIRHGQADDFNIRDMTEITKTMTATSTLMSALLLVVAGISLVVGGVGIMNIMLVSVTERTREIGLRMAVGARSHHILRQFLVEAVVLCLVGGAIGIVFGRGLSILVRSIRHWPTEASLPAIIAAVAVSATVGIVFGFYPAWKASRLDPIEALRYE